MTTKRKPGRPATGIKRPRLNSTVAPETLRAFRRQAKAARVSVGVLLDRLAATSLNSPT